MALGPVAEFWKGSLPEAGSALTMPCVLTASRGSGGTRADPTFPDRAAGTGLTFGLVERVRDHMWSACRASHGQGEPRGSCMSWDRERLSCCFISCQAGSSQAELLRASSLESASWGSWQIKAIHSTQPLCW